ncbi:High osmolarity signaling protein SHO1 like [Verticillium longisporum]|nr:High osmolarity signaling protein SHO1 like [Verticillium longisporum]
MGNVIGDPFALASISIAMLAWVIAFISSIVAAVQTNDLPNLAWWILALEVGIVGAVFFVVASDTIQTYHVALTAYQTLALATLSILLNRIVYDGRGAMQAASAGYVLLSVVMALWMIYFGSAPSASPRAYVDSFALQKEGHGSRNTMTYGTGRPET